MIDDYVRHYADSELKEFWRDYITTHFNPNDPRLPMIVQEEKAKLAWIHEFEHTKKPLPPQASDTFGTKGYMCIFCKQYNVKMETVQTRSLDERSVHIFYCQNSACNKKWKQ